MNGVDKKTLLFLPLLFGIFFFLVVITGFFQYRVIKDNMERLIRNEGEIVFNHLKREINQTLEYLNIVETSPAVIPSDFIDILAYDEAIIADFYYIFKDIETTDMMDIPLPNFIVLDRDGRKIAEKGSVKISRSDMDSLLKNKQDTLVRMSAEKTRPLHIGFRVDNRFIFLSIDSNEFNALRKRYIIKDIIEKEVERFNIKGISLYDDQNRIYIEINGKTKGSSLISNKIDSRFLKDYRMDIYISRETTDSVLKKIAISFLFILLSLVVAGAISTSIVFVFMRRYERHMEEVKKEMALNERLISLGNLASGMAHEIRNPLNAMSLSIQRLKKEFMPSDEKKEEYNRFIDILKSEIIRVNRIVEDFLASTGTQAPFTKESLSQVIEEVIILLKEEASTKNIDIHYKANESTTIECQKERLKQALHNVILNSIQAIENKGRIVVETSIRDREIAIIIRDTGIGIKKEDMDKIFDYYYTTKEKGIGVGLAISYMIIKDHGGSIRVESSEGIGTTFTITLPLERDKGQLPARDFKNVGEV
ncbi:MAG TPA: ATP-binding protein [Syntrophorhabdaceae bacterium]|nr:ATP-binding protein [Syntrophorhabdaceae bacterium]